MKPILACSLVAVLLPAHALAAQDKLNDYLVDISGGSVSAAALVGIDKGITQIETSQDVIVLLQPLASGASKATVALAVTPARTSLMPMSGKTYLRNSMYRLLGSVTLSYARATETLSGADYKKSAYSIGTVYYLSKPQDPIAIGNQAFVDCAKELNAKNATENDAVTLNPTLDAAAKQAALKGLTQALNLAITQCIDSRLKQETRWNASKVSVSFGNARIEAPNGRGYTLTRNATLNIQYGLGDSGMVSASLRQTRRGLDVSTINSASGPVFKNSSLVAVRFTYGDTEGTSFRTILEASNAKSRSAGVDKEAFIYALGLDRKIGNGIWLELRVGRNRRLDNGKEQTTGLMNLNVAPSLLPFKL